MKKISFKMTFRDTGCGITKENQKLLFKNFSKLNETQFANKEGVGLGLSICREIIMTLGGSVDIESEPGNGTDFIISLKIKSIVNQTLLRKAAIRI